MTALVLWTALSLALGVEVQGQVIRGLPCIKRLNQLFCRNAGNSYPTDNIQHFIDDNRALMKRMHGEFLSDLTLGEVVESTIRGLRARRYIEDDPPPFDPNNITSNHIVNTIHEDDPSATPAILKDHQRPRRQASSGIPLRSQTSNRIDACNSKMEIVTPYWASNSAGNILAIVNLNEFSQVIHQEVCTKQSTKRCSGDCGCEQKYKWHRLLAYDLDNECKGVFVDWFLFPSCCVCRCDP